MVAALIYLIMAAITFATLLSVHGGLRRFALRARRIREQGPDAGSFADRNNLPELADVAAEFDRMVDALHRSAADLRRTAEDNAHAFKTPIAVIRQSIEPLRRALPEDNQRAQRAIGVVEHSLDRLDGLVTSARSLDEATADLIAKPRVPVDLGRVIGGLIQIRSGILASRDVSIILASHDLTISADLLPGLFVLGTEEMIETVVENLIDNAVSFLRARQRNPDPPDPRRSFCPNHGLRPGPGVPAEQLERIFDRYYSERRAERRARGIELFGIGLWIARRNVEAMGGTIEAENRSPHGMAVHVRMPLAPESAAAIFGPLENGSEAESGIWIKALIRRCDLAAIPIAVLARGDDDAGAILLKFNGREAGAWCWRRHAGGMANSSGCGPPAPLRSPKPTPTLTSRVNVGATRTSGWSKSRMRLPKPSSTHGSRENGEVVARDRTAPSRRRDRAQPVDFRALSSDR